MTDRRYHEKRERILSAIRFQAVDRLPFTGGNATIAALKQVTGRDDYLTHPKEVFTQAVKMWDADAVLQFVLPDRQDKQMGPKAGVDVWHGLLSVLYQMIDEWKTTHGDFQSPEELRDFCQTIPRAEDANKYVDEDVTYQRWLELDAWGEFFKPVVWVPGHSCGTVGWMWYLEVGYENFLMAHALYPEEMKRLFAFAGEEGRLINIAIARAIHEHDMIPLVYSGEDICGNDGPLASPKSLRELYFPYLKRAVEPLIDAGVHWMWHSDGDIMPIVPDLLDCGIDGFQGFEEDKGMDMVKLAGMQCKNGRLPFLRGSISVTSTMYTTPAEIRADVQRMIDLSDSRGGGVILAPSSSIMANTPTENVLAFYEACVNQVGDRITSGKRVETQAELREFMNSER